jgi:hypothetical protein
MTIGLEELATRERGWLGGSAMETPTDNPVCRTRSEAASRRWAKLPEEKVFERTANGLSRRAARLEEADADASGSITDVLSLPPAERLKRVMAYEKRRTMREARGSTGSTCPLADAVALMILDMYDVNPELKRVDMAQTAAEKPVCATTTSTSVCRRDAALARWENTSKEERRTATAPGLSAGKTAKIDKAMNEFATLSSKMSQGILTPSERLQTVEKYKSRLARREKTGVKTSLCVELDDLASELLQQYVQNPQLRYDDLKHVRRCRLQSEAF